MLLLEKNIEIFLEAPSWPVSIESPFVTFIQQDVE